MLKNITRWPVLQKVRYQGLTPLYLFVSTWFQILFHSPFGVLFTFPSRYLFTIGHMDVFRLGRWSSRLPTKFLVFDGTLSRQKASSSSTGLSPSLELLSRSFDSIQLFLCAVGLFPVRSPLLRESRLLSFPPVTEMFQFTGSPPLTLWIGVKVTGSSPAGFLHSETCGSTLFAACRSYRSLASFFGAMCQGIHLVLFSI